jgi:hypothetical protein
MFDYPSLLKKLSVPLLCNAIGEYLREELDVGTIPSSKINCYIISDIERMMYTDLLRLFSKQKHIQLSSTFKLLLEKHIVILRELCKLIYNKIKVINELEFNVGMNDMMFPNQQLAVEELVNLRDCFRGLKVLDYSGSSNILWFFANHCKRIESLKLRQVTYSTLRNFDDEDPSAQLISDQKSLRDLEIHDWNTFSLANPNVTMLLQSIQEQSDSLRIIKLVNCDFYKSKPLWPISRCQNLEKIIIAENYNFDQRLLVPLANEVYGEFGRNCSEFENQYL